MASPLLYLTLLFFSYPSPNVHLLLNHIGQTSEIQQTKCQDEEISPIQLDGERQQQGIVKSKQGQETLSEWKKPASLATDAPLL